MKRFENKVVIVTGGNSGIGRAAALAFAMEGARVVIAARNVERGEEVVSEIEAAGGEALFAPTDVSRADQVEKLIAKTVKAYGRLDCAFNNAGTEDGVFALTADFSEEDFERTISNNLKSVWLCMKYEINQMLKQESAGGSIVNTSSVNGLGGVPTGSLYATAKAGVLALTKSAALEYAQQGIRVNALVAGGFRTPMLERLFDRASGGDAAQLEAVESDYQQAIAMGRVGTPEEAAEVALWLCSDVASYVTGHSMIVDGGLSAATR